MASQQDYTVRIVALENLRAMCARVSGMCHRYEITKVTRASVHITYSNPNEWGSESPMTMIFRAFPSDWRGDSENPRVILEAGRVIYDTDDGEGWQNFEPVLNCPILFRAGFNGDWNTREEIEAAKLAIADAQEGSL